MKQVNKIYKDLAGIGVEISGVKPNRLADIERTILSVSELIDTSDRRILGLVLSWIALHGKIVSISKLKRIQRLEKLGDLQIISAFAFFAVQNGFHTWKPLAKKYSPKILWDSDSTRSALNLKGEEDILIKAGIKLPKGFLRIRTTDILPIDKLSKMHLQVRLRLIFGVNPRADAIFYLSLKSFTANTLKKVIGCSYEPANRIIKEFRTAHSFSLPNLNL